MSVTALSLPHAQSPACGGGPPGLLVWFHRTMLRNRWTLVIIIASAIPATRAALSQKAQDTLEGLVETSARRLAIAKEVALAKWDSGAPVEDAPREAQVIASAVKDGAAIDLEPASVESFFRAQIEANKVVQYALLADSAVAPVRLPHTHQSIWLRQSGRSWTSCKPH